MTNQAFHQMISSLTLQFVSIAEVVLLKAWMCVKLICISTWLYNCNEAVINVGVRKYMYVYTLVQ
jgi:hypothetical protein